jgi:NAD(P)-dependent dehydrogenase (short-subunit alcohol dehydrogenase family)
MKGPVVVIDAANGIGRGVVQAALNSGRSVIAVSRDPNELRALRKRHADADLSVVTGSIADEVNSAALADRLRELDRPIAGIVIAACGEPARGRVLDLSAQSFQRRLEVDLLPQVAAAQQLLPLLSESGRNGGYVVIGSPGSEHPWAGYGHRSVAAAAINMLVRVLHDEARALGVRVQLLAISRPARTDENREYACDGWPAALAIGEQALALIDQTEPRQAAGAVVNFVKGGPRAAVDAAARTSPELMDSTDSSLLAAEPALLAEMISTPANAPVVNGGAEPDGQRYLDQAWALLEPLFASKRNEANKP